MEARGRLSSGVTTPLSNVSAKEEASSLSCSKDWGEYRLFEDAPKGLEGNPLSSLRGWGRGGVDDGLEEPIGGYPANLPSSSWMNHLAKPWRRRNRSFSF
ncbi:UNVERIFIED_CONTAM: hypothetical protein Slati_1919200 [Sesamum latifolium]|uniref:Uncharacterized protein n=1 Tax=Sesamum latifolium TaxID=2727402 RepID=A0AAW2X261_9LAMI